MEYHCVVLCDPVVEPGVLLRRLLYIDIAPHEMRALRRQTLLSIRAQENLCKSLATGNRNSGSGAGDGAHSNWTTTYPMSVSLPDLGTAGTFSMPNPAMPSVDIIIRFSVITDPSDLMYTLPPEQHRGSSSHYSPTRERKTQAAFSPRAAFPRGASSASLSSNTNITQTAAAAAAAGNASALLLLHPPHAIVVAFTPLSLSCFTKMRMECPHILKRYQRLSRGDGYQHISYFGPTAMSAARPTSAMSSASVSHMDPTQEAGIAATTNSNVGTSLSMSAGAGAGTMSFPHRPAPAPHPTLTLIEPMSSSSPLAQHPLSQGSPSSMMVGSPMGTRGVVRPTVILVSTRHELMRQVLEATPLVPEPPIRDVTEVATSLQAKAFIEVGIDWDDTIDALRLAIARACVGDLADSPVVSHAEIQAVHRGSLLRGFEELRDFPDFSHESESSGSFNAQSDMEANVDCDATSPLKADSAVLLEDTCDAHRRNNVENGRKRDPDKVEDGVISQIRKRVYPDLSIACPSEMVLQQCTGLPAVLGCTLSASPLCVAAAAAVTDGSTSRREAAASKPVTTSQKKAQRNAWTWRRTRDGQRIYYVHRATRRAQYERPDGYDGKPLPCVVEVEEEKPAGVASTVEENIVPPVAAAAPQVAKDRDTYDDGAPNPPEQIEEKPSSRKTKGVRPEKEKVVIVRHGGVERNHSEVLSETLEGDSVADATVSWRRRREQVEAQLKVAEAELEALQLRSSQVHTAEAVLDGQIQDLSKALGHRLERQFTEDGCYRCDGAKEKCGHGAGDRVGASKRELQRLNATLSEQSLRVRTLTAYRGALRLDIAAAAMQVTQLWARTTELEELAALTAAEAREQRLRSQVAAQRVHSLYLLAE